MFEGGQENSNRVSHVRRDRKKEKETARSIVQGSRQYRGQHKVRSKADIIAVTEPSRTLKKRFRRADVAVRNGANGLKVRTLCQTFGFVTPHGKEVKKFDIVWLVALGRRAAGAGVCTGPGCLRCTKV